MSMKRKHPISSIIKKNARDLRKKSTKAEITLWNKLKNRQIGNMKFRRQHPIGGYILDFFCLEHLLGIEIDGSIHELPDRRRYDDVRTELLNEIAIRIIRFSNHEIHTDIENVIHRIVSQTLAYPEFKPSPSEADGRGSAKGRGEGA